MHLPSCDILVVVVCACVDVRSVANVVVEAGVVGGVVLLVVTVAGIRSERQ